MKAYLSVFRLRRRLETQYRGAVLGGMICQMFFGIILIAVYRALYAGKPQDYPVTQIASYVWLQQAFFRMLLASDPDLLDKIRTGGITYDLCRPLSLYGFYYVRILAQKMMGSLLRAAPMLVFALLYTPCVAAIAAIKREMGFKWAAGVVLWQCGIAWIVAFIVRLVGMAMGMA